ncbi:hypothetical protein DE146DRAFT_648980 [Phaeosphaeria sp. MPI-PUGE-AT-0046c]|nr:hypothetical protein DE146DRAFT_648980 [Phaeosphaeria sp. MPI-PUGE-AT-0046c]
MHFILSSLLPTALAAAFVARQTLSSEAYSWSGPGATYDGQTILGSFSNLPNTDSSSPGITATNFDGATATSLNVTVQNLMSSVKITQIFAAVHSDRVRLLHVGKPLSDQVSSFISGGSGDFGSIDTTYVYGTRVLDASIGSGQYLNFSLPLTLPSNANNDDDDDDDDDEDSNTDRLSETLDNLDAHLTIIARIGLGQTFLVLNAMDLGDREESGTAALYSSAAGFVTLSSGYVNESLALPATRAAYVLTYTSS